VSRNCDQTNPSNEEPVRPWGRPRSKLARRRDRERAEDDAERIRDLRYLWGKGCARTTLGRMIYMPSGASVSVPTISQIHLGPPVTFRVQMHPGQTLDDFNNAAPQIAAALDVGGLQFIPVAPQWLRVVLLPKNLGGVFPPRDKGSQTAGGSAS
jgi:hypothetical protein